MKKLATLWYLWLVIGFVLGGLVFRQASIVALAPFGFVILCMIMMLFMMGSHGHSSEKDK